MRKNKKILECTIDYLIMRLQEILEVLFQRMVSTFFVFNRGACRPLCFFLSTLNNKNYIM